MLKHVFLFLFQHVHATIKNGYKKGFTGESLLKLKMKTVHFHLTSIKYSRAERGGG